MGANGADMDEKKVWEAIGLAGKEDDEELSGITVKAIKLLHRHYFELEGWYKDLSARIARIDDESEKRYETNRELIQELKKHRAAMAATSSSLSDLGSSIQQGFTAAGTSHNQLAEAVNKLSGVLENLVERVEALEDSKGPGPKKTRVMSAIDIERLQKRSRTKR